MKGFFVTGIDTNVGKTVISAILTEALKADYWKPIQSGGLEYTDSDFIREFTLHVGEIHQEQYAFHTPVSPHLAAKYEDVDIDIQHIKLNLLKNNIIVEGAGGIMVPLSDNFLIIDLIKQLQLAVILVSKNYLGSINHTLMTIALLKQYNIPIAGIVFNGISNAESEAIILQFSGIPLLGKIPKADIMSKGFIIQQAEKIKPKLLPLIQNETTTQPLDQLPLDYDAF